MGSAVDMTLHLDFSPKKQKKGGFKLASFGTASQPLFGAQYDISAKQTFYQKTALTGQAGKEIKVTQNIPHDGVTQIHNLAMEIACLVWACILLDIVYKFVDMVIALCGVPPFPIPQMHFVEAALAVEHNISESSEAQVFLLEEVIGEVEGCFRKYVNNISAVPVSFSNTEDEE